MGGPARGPLDTLKSGPDSRKICKRWKSAGVVFADGWMTGTVGKSHKRRQRFDERFWRKCAYKLAIWRMKLYMSQLVIMLGATAVLTFYFRHNSSVHRPQDGERNVPVVFRHCLSSPETSHGRWWYRSPVRLSPIAGEVIGHYPPDIPLGQNPPPFNGKAG